MNKKTKVTIYIKNLYQTLLLPFIVDDWQTQAERRQTYVYTKNKNLINHTAYHCYADDHWCL